MADEQEANLSAMQKFRDTEKKRLEREAAAKAKLKAGGGKTAAPPTLSPPAPINTENPAASLSGSPLAMPNFGQAGGPQPGSPLQGGQGEGGGGLAPFLMSQQRTEDVSLQETQPGVRQFVPSQRTTTQVQPNVLSADAANRGQVSMANQAARIRLQLAMTKQDSFEAYLDDVAKMAVYAKNDPSIDQAVTQEIVNLARSNPAAIPELERRMGVVMANREEFAERNPREVFDPRSPTGSAFVPGGHHLMGHSGKVGLGREIGTAMAGAIESLGNVLGDKELADIRTDVRMAGDTIAGLRMIEAMYDPAFLELPSKWLVGIGTWIEGKGIDTLDEGTKDLITRYNAWRSVVLDAQAAYQKRVTGLVANEAEMRRILHIMPHPDDSNSALIGKWQAQMRANTMLVARYNHYLNNRLMGEDSIGAALNADPKLHFDFSPDVLSDGEQQMMRLAAERETAVATRIRDAMREGGGPINEAYIRKQASKETANYFGIDLDLYDEFLRSRGQ